MWIDTIYDLTPVEEHSGMTFKRDDKFAPKGYGHINGAKMRQCIWLVDEWVKTKGIKGVVSGSVSQSPQHAFISEICKHYGIGCVITHAKKDINDSPYLRLAKQNGSKLIYSKVGYAKTLGALSKKLLDRLDNHEYLETNITVEESVNTWDRIEQFHRVGAEQVKNIPEHIDTLIIPCGSCNSVTSILYGLALFPKPLKKIILMGIGNHGSNNLGYIENRIKHIAEWKGIDIDNMFDWEYMNNPRPKYSMFHYNLNGSGFCKYTDTMHEKADSITFHPRYEGKCIRYIKTYLKHLWKPTTMFWIVGSDMRL